MTGVLLTDVPLAHCEACLAPLFDEDDWGMDESGITLCWRAMDRDGPCYSDRVPASGMEAPSGGETGTGSTEGDSPTAESGDAQ